MLPRFNWVTEDRCDGIVQEANIGKIWDEWKYDATKAVINKELMQRTASSMGRPLDEIVAVHGSRGKHREMMTRKRCDTLSQRVEKSRSYRIGRENACTTDKKINDACTTDKNMKDRVVEEE